MTTAKPAAFHQGYESKAAEIAEMGWVASRDKFNGENTPGQPWTGTPDGLAYAHGEYQALCDRMPRAA